MRPTRAALDRFFEAIEAEPPVVYGRGPTGEALEYDAVETLLVSATLPAAEIRRLEERAADQGGEVVVVPEGIDRGEQYREAFGGVGALLRFSIE